MWNSHHGASSGWVEVGDREWSNELESAKCRRSLAPTGRATQRRAIGRFSRLWTLRRSRLGTRKSRDVRSKSERGQVQPKWWTSSRTAAKRCEPAEKVELVGGNNRLQHGETGLGQDSLFGRRVFLVFRFSQKVFSNL